MSERICEYGCGRLARYPPRKGMLKWCCEEDYRKCPAVRKSYGSPGEKNPMFEKNQTQETKDLISKVLTGRKAPRNYKPVELRTNEFKCDFGCGSVANYRLANGKNCCTEHQSSCPSVRSRIGSGVKGKMVGENHPFYDKTHTDVVKGKLSEFHEGNRHAAYTLESFLKKFPFFTKYEEIREVRGKKLQGRCKECGKWFTPKDNSVLATRALAIKLKNTLDAFGNAYLFCSDECKQKSDVYYKKKDPHHLKEFAKYHRMVLKYTFQSIQNDFDKIGNSKIKKINDDFELDHKYSVAAGFKNNIDPEIIGHWTNLEYIIFRENRSKHQKCSITIEELQKHFNQTK